MKCGNTTLYVSAFEILAECQSFGSAKCRLSFVCDRQIQEWQLLLADIVLEMIGLHECQSVALKDEPDVDEEHAILICRRTRPYGGPRRSYSLRQKPMNAASGSRGGSVIHSRHSRSKW